MECKSETSHQSLILSMPPAVSMGSPPSLSPEAAIPSPNQSSTHKCPNSGFVWVVSQSIHLDPSDGDQIDTKDGQIDANNSQICSTSLTKRDVDDIYSFDWAQRVEDEGEEGWVPDTEEPFDLGIDFGFPVKAPATTRSSQPFLVSFPGEDGGAQTTKEVDGYVSDSGDEIPPGAHPRSVLTRRYLETRPS